MNLKKAKLEFFYLRKSFLEYQQGFKYLKNKYWLAKKILDQNKIFEKEINFEQLSIHLLTGRSHLIMLLWSLASFYQQMKIIGPLYIHSDGSLLKQDIDLIRKFFPNVRIIGPEEFLSANQDKLAKYPVIKKFRTEYSQFFLLKKLIDPYFASDKKFRLIIDSDLIWFQEPKEIEREIKNECQDSLMADNNNLCPVYFKDGIKLSDEKASYNSGMVLYQKENFDLRKLTDYLEKIDLNHFQNRHFIEQAGYASCLENLKKLPASYTIAGDLNKNVIMKHYTSPRRPLFYIEGIEKLRDNLLK